jgi:hypothetical protein
MFGNKRAYRKEKSANSNQLAGGINRIALRATGFMLRCQSRWSEFMSRQTNRYTTCKLKWGLVLFCLFYVCFSFYAIIQPFTNSSSNAQSQITPPNNQRASIFLKKQPLTLEKPEMVITETDFQKIQIFRKFMDSLSSSTNGRKQYQNILRVRPGLIDSVAMAEKIYYSQKKK